jgi:hypothetical protein
MTIQQTTTAIKKLSRSLDPEKSKVFFRAVQLIEGKIKERVFIKKLSTSGTTRPYRSKKWIAAREKKGRQVALVDLYFEGKDDSESLYRTFKTIKQDDKVYMIVDNDWNFSVKLAKEEGERGDILQPNDSELKYLSDMMQTEVNALIEDIFA